MSVPFGARSNLAPKVGGVYLFVWKKRTRRGKEKLAKGTTRR